MTGYIFDLNPSTPDGADDIASGDDVIREAKLYIKNSFPKIAGEVSASQTELNKLAGFIGNVVTDAGDTISGTMVFINNVRIDNANLSVSGGEIFCAQIRGGFILTNATFENTATFSAVPYCAVTPTDDNHLARKAYVDAAVAGGSDPQTVDVAAFKYARLKMFFYGD